jgi:hypothetical protein
MPSAAGTAGAAHIIISHQHLLSGKTQSRTSRRLKTLPTPPQTNTNRLTLPNDGQDDACSRVDEQHSQPHAPQRGSGTQQPAAPEVAKRLRFSSAGSAVLASSAAANLANTMSKQQWCTAVQGSIFQYITVAHLPKPYSATMKKCMTSTEGRGLRPDSSDTGPAATEQGDTQRRTHSSSGSVRCVGAGTRTTTNPTSPTHRNGISTRCAESEPSSAFALDPPTATSRHVQRRYCDQPPYAAHGQPPHGSTTRQHHPAAPHSSTTRQHHQAAPPGSTTGLT